MNKRAIVYVLGAVLLIGAALMLPPLLVALIYHEVSGWYFLWVMLGAAVLGALALRLGGGKRAVMYAKEGLIAVALSWIVLSLVGALPFTLSGQIPFYLDAVFEMISGFTTTGPSSISRHRITFANGEKNAKLPAGPHRPRPGPMLLNVAMTAVSVVEPS